MGDMRERMIEVLKDNTYCPAHRKCDICQYRNPKCSIEIQVDKLIQAGAVLPPCKVDDIVYYIDVSIEPNDRGRWTTRKRVKAVKFHYGMLDWIETPLYLTEEDAQNTIKELTKK